MANAYKGNFTMEDVEQIEAFREWIRAYGGAHDVSSSTEWVQEFTSSFMQQVSFKLEDKEYWWRLNHMFDSFFDKEGLPPIGPESDGLFDPHDQEPFEDDV